MVGRAQGETTGHTGSKYRQTHRRHIEPEAEARGVTSGWEAAWQHLNSAGIQAAVHSDMVPSVKTCVLVPVSGKLRCDVLEQPCSMFMAILSSSVEGTAAGLAMLADCTCPVYGCGSVQSAAAVIRRAVLNASAAFFCLTVGGQAAD